MSADRGVVALLFGLSGAGKSTIATATAARLRAAGLTVQLLDGDIVRATLSADLGFGPADRREQLRRVAAASVAAADQGAVVIAALIAPEQAARDAFEGAVRSAGHRFVDVHVATSLGVCEARDVKGLYAAARAGRIEDFTGVSAPFDWPEHSSVRVDGGVGTIEEASLIVASAILRARSTPAALPE